MKKAILALTICAVIGGFSVTGNVLAVPLSSPTSGDFTDQSNIDWAKSVNDTFKSDADLFFDHQSQITQNVIDTATAQSTATKAETDAASANTAAGNAQHAADLAQTKADDNETKVNNHEGRIQTVEGEATLNGLHIQGLQADIVSHGDRMNDLQKQTDNEVTRAKAAEAVNATTAGDAKTLATTAQTTAVAANTTATQAKTQATTNAQRIDNHESRITALEAANGNGSAFEDLKNKVDDNRQRASAAISGVAAMANIPQVIQGQTFAVGAGVGTTDGESALAVGLSARAAEHVVVKASVSDDSQQNFVVGAGASYGW
ncbi:YadA C-terminal domain-containing protein [Kluyvera ascorbata]|uniref:YadA C-terminal domain-containing protein n=1 Tax=Kluyvera ascorbata TaxID=51288 RepID=UPI0039F69A9D